MLFFRDFILLGIIACIGASFNTHAALTIERSRLIFNENDKSISVKVTNRNKKDPYLLQSWIENEKEEKIISSLMVLPPLQRIEPGAKTLIRIEKMPDIDKLPKDRESVFYLNMREIPPKSEKKERFDIGNSVQTKSVLQTRFNQSRLIP